MPVGATVVGTAVVGAEEVGVEVVGTEVVGTAVVGTAVVGDAVVVTAVGDDVGSAVNSSQSLSPGQSPSQIRDDAESQEMEASSQLVDSVHSTNISPVPQYISVLPLHASLPSQIRVTSVASELSITEFPEHTLSPMQLMMQGSPERHSNVLSLHLSLPLQLCTDQCQDNNKQRHTILLHTVGFSI